MHWRSEGAGSYILQAKKVRQFRPGGIAILFLWAACIFDPVGMLFNIKFVAITIVYVVISFKFIKRGVRLNITKDYIWFFAFFAVVLPIFGVTVSVFNGVSEIGGDTSYISSAVYVGCSLLYLFPGYLGVACQSLSISLRALTLSIWLTLLAIITGHHEVLTEFYFNRGIAYIGEREYSSVDFYYIYFVASPMLIYLVCKDAWELALSFSLKRLLILFVTAGALFLSGTRANMVLAVISPFFVMTWFKYGRATLFFVLLLAGAFILTITVFNIPIVSEMFGPNEQSNSTKIAYLESYYQIFSDPLILLVGQGFNAKEWSGVVAAMLPEGANKTELSYLEMIRVFGFFGLFFLLLLLKRLSINGAIARTGYPWIAPALILYATVSALNPYIFSSNGMLLLGFSAAVLSVGRVATSDRQQSA
jgi:hypothetical protein